MINHVIVVGGGSAGFLAAISLKTRLPDLRVTVIRSKEIGIIGVGEGSTLAFPAYLHGHLRIDMGEFLRVAQPTWKLGLRFFEWGPRPFFDYTFAPNLQARWNDLAKPIGFYCDDVYENSNLNSALCSHDRVFARGKQGEPLIHRDFGYHVENVNFVTFLESHAQRVGVVIQEDTIEHVEQGERGVTNLRLKSGATASADLYVDCSGFVSLLLGKTLNERFISFKPTLYCDRAIVGGWERAPADEPIRPYTTCQGMDAGWCWRIDHERRINRGYVYSSAFISDDDAGREFRQKNPKIGDTRIVHFVSGRYERCWVRNVVAIGNATGFVEPLEATSLGAICDESYMLGETLAESDRNPNANLADHYNRRSGVKWDYIRDFLSIHYRFNTRFETPFWRECRDRVELCGAADIVEHFLENGPGYLYRQNTIDPRNQFGIEGYLQLLVGMKVPYRARYKPTEREARLWEEIRAHLNSQAASGFTIPEALQLVRAPTWQWNPDFFRRSYLLA
jgi:tryptophan halogenase